MRLSIAIWWCIGLFFGYFFAFLSCLVYNADKFALWSSAASMVGWGLLVVYFLVKWGQLTADLDVDEDDVKLVGYAKTPVSAMPKRMGTGSEEGTGTIYLSRMQSEEHAATSDSFSETFFDEYREGGSFGEATQR